MANSSFLGLIQNIVLLLAIVLVFDLSPVYWRVGRIGPWQLPAGLLIGAIGMVVMLTPWVLLPGIVFDTRSVLPSISGLFFGLVPTAIAMLMTAALRIYQGGAGTAMGVSVIFVTGSLGILMRHLYRRKLTALSGWNLYLFGLVIHIAMLACAFTLPLETALNVINNISLPVMVIYPLGTLLLGRLMVNRIKREEGIEDLKRRESRLSSLSDILQQRTDNIQEFLDYALSEALKLTESKLGYIYFYSEEKKQFILNSWSKDVMDECRVRDAQVCYELDKTGIWGEAVRQRKPIMLNDFQAVHPLKKGYPEGHVALQKFLTIPIISDDQIVAVVGVANKESDYDQSDVLQLRLLMESVWRVTERKRVEEELRQSEERYRGIIENLPNGIVHIMDRDFRYIFNAGPELAKVGLTNEMLLGKSIYDTLEPELAEETALQYQRVLEGQSIEYEGDYGGTSFLVHASPLRNAAGNVEQILVLSMNVTERKRAEEALRRSEDLYRGIIENIPNGIIHILDRDFHYIFNAGDELKKIGLSNEMLVGKNISDILDPAQAKIFEGYYQRVLKGEKIEFEGSYRGQSYLVHAAPLRDAAGNIEQILALSINITERYQSDKKIKEAQTELRKMFETAEQARQALLSVVEDQKLAEEKIRQLNATLEERVRDRTAQLEVANQELESFAYSVSHDLRAPLRAMDGFSAVLLSEHAERLDDQGKHYLGRIQEASRRMGQLINDLLNLSRVTRSEITWRKVDLSALAGEIATSLQAAEPERVLEFDITPELVVMGDAHLLKIALENLIGNAFKFTGKIPQGRIQVGVKELDGERVFFVRDNGAGFDMAYSGKLFAPFQRLHGMQEFPGTGIGLVTVQRIIRRHGGRIWPEAAPNAGAVFYFTIGGG